MDKESRMVSVTLPESAWRGIHACLLELCHIWDGRVRPAKMSEPGEKEASVLLERIVPVLSLASAWPDVADFEARVRRMWDMPVPEQVLEMAREMVRPVEDATWQDATWQDDSWQDHTWHEDAGQDDTGEADTGEDDGWRDGEAA